MKKIEGKLLAVTALAGFLGGFAADRLFTVSVAEAAKAAKVPKALTAEEFRLVDSKGKVQVKLGFNADGLATVFWQGQGKENTFVLGKVSAPQPRKPGEQPPPPAPKPQ